MGHLLHTGIQTHMCTLLTLIHHTHLQVQLLIHMHMLLIHILTFLHIPSTIPILHLLDYPHHPPILVHWNILTLLLIKHPPQPLLLPPIATIFHHLTLIPTIFLQGVIVLLVLGLPFHTIPVYHMDHLITIINKMRPIHLMKINLVPICMPIASLAPTGRRPLAPQEVKKYHKLVLVPSLLRILLTHLWMIL